MKTINRNDMVCFCITLLLVTYLKSAYILNIHTDNDFYTYYIFFGDNNIVNIIWLTPILLQVFFITKRAYQQLIFFDMRYRNRKHRIITAYLEIILSNLVYSITAIIIQLIGLFLLNDIQVLPVNLGAFIFKYMFELLVMIMILLLLSTSISQFTISYIFVITTLILIITVYPNFYFPIVSLFVNYHFNIISVFVYICVAIIIWYLYKTKDLTGGITHDLTN